MVLKAGKRGVKSGNTLRASTARTVRLLGKQPCMMRRHVRQTIDAGGSEFDNALGEEDVSADGVPFSLNKKRRWALPALLKSQILRGDFKDKEFGVELIERHTICGPTNVISICSSKGVAKTGNSKTKQMKKRKGYLNRKCVLSTKPPRPRRRLYLRPPPDEPVVPQTNSVIYDVVYPVPKSSSITHNPKRIGYDTRHLYYDLREMSKTRNTRRHRYRQTCAETIEESLRLLTDGCYDDSEEEDAVLQDADSVTCTRETSVFLGDVLHVAKVQGVSHIYKITRHRSCSNGSIGHAQMSDKKHIVYVAKDDEIPSVMQPTTQVRQATTVEPVRIVLTDEDVDPHNMNSRYGHQYLECECFPRKFILDISTDMSNLDRLKFVGDIRADKPVACLVFTHDVDNEINNLKENVYKVSLNLKFHQSLDNVKIATLFDYSQCNIDEVIQKTLFFIETFPTDVIIQERMPYDRTPCKMDGALEKCAQWTCVAHLPTDRYLYETYVAKTRGQISPHGFEFISRIDAYSQEDVADITSPRDRVCYICYSVLGLGDAATALTACGHWFCDQCWREHLTTSISAGAVTLLCPEYDCNRAVDRATLLSLVNMEQVIRHVKCCHDTVVEQQDVTKWCPALHCGRVVQVNSTEVNNAQCACENKFCFKCLRNIHWPAPCDAVPKYVKKLYDSGDIAILPQNCTTPVFVNGKNCPHCKRFIEKNGGCPCMTCVCGNNFCWGCGMPWASSMHEDCYRVGHKDTHGTVEITIDGDTKRRVTRNGRKWYQSAVRHRVQQHPLKLQQLKSALSDVSKTLRAYVGRAALRGEPVRLYFQPFTNKTYTSDANKVHDFLKRMVELYTELNHTAEYVGVLLDSRTLATDSYRPFSMICTRLGAFGALIYKTFTDCAAHKSKETLERLQDIHVHSTQCIEGLVRLVRKLGL